MHWGLTQWPYSLTSNKLSPANEVCATVQHTSLHNQATLCGVSAEQFITVVMVSSFHTEEVGTGQR